MDSFMTRFFISYWGIMKGSIMDFTSLSRLDAHGFGAINHALVTLLS
jgi:hypothetical protein